MKRPDSEVLESFQKLELMTMQETQNSKTSKPHRIVVSKKSITKIPKPDIPNPQPVHLKPKPNPAIPPSEPIPAHSTPLSPAPIPNPTNLLCKSFKLKILRFDCEDSSLYPSLTLETWLYRPYSNSSPIFFPDSFSTTSLSRGQNSFEFSSKTLHSFDLISNSDTQLSDLQLEFFLYSDSSLNILIGQGSLPWCEVISSETTSCNYSLPITESDQAVGSLKLKLVLNSSLSQEPTARAPDILFIYLDHIYRFEDQMNLFVQYKSPFDKQVIRSQVYWAYSGQALDHEILLPSTQLVPRLNSKTLVLEVWDKNQSLNKDMLLGLARVSFVGLSAIFDSNIYPTVVWDDYVPVVSPGKGSEIAFLKVALAYGTYKQINKFSLSRRGLNEVGSKTLEFKNSGHEVGRVLAKSYMG